MRKYFSLLLVLLSLTASSQQWKQYNDRKKGVYYADSLYANLSYNTANTLKIMVWDSVTGKVYQQNIPAASNGINNQIASAQNADFWIDGYGIADILVASTRVEVNKVFGINNGIVLTNTGGGQIELGGGSSSGFVPLVKLTPDGSVYNYSAIQSETQDAGAIASLFLEGRTSTGALATQDVVAFGSYGTAYMTLKANKSLQLNDYTTGTHTGTLDYLAGFTSNGTIIRVDPLSVGSSQTLSQTLTEGNVIGSAQSIDQTNGSNTIGSWYNDGGVGRIDLSDGLTIGITLHGDGEITASSFVSTKNLIINNAAATANVTLGTAATANRIIDFPDASGTLALTSNIPTDNATLTNGAGYLTSSTVSGTLVGVRVLTSTVASTYTPTSGTTKAVVILIGGGGGGGGASGANSSVGVGGGGGAGGYTLKYITGISSSTSYNYTAGSAGTGGANTGGTGGSGGATSITFGATTYTAQGGSGGVGQTAGTTAAMIAGGSGAALGTNGDIMTSGDPGGVAYRVSGTLGFSGKGGSTEYGAGGTPIIAASAGVNAGGYGGGGGGAMSTANTNRAGGNGTQGVIIIYEYK